MYGHAVPAPRVAPGIFAQEGRCWRFLYENPSGQAGHRMEPVACVVGSGTSQGGSRCGAARGTPTIWWARGSWGS
jgi:hypothetical protein